MNLESLWSYIVTFLSSSAVTAIALLWLFIKNPEKIERWISMITRGFAWADERIARIHMATDIQSAIAGKRKNLGMTERGLSYGIKVKWADADTILSDLEDNKVVVMFRPYKSQSKNFAHVVSVYVPKALLPKSRRYVDSNLMTSIDYTISKSILDIDPTALEYYTSQILGDVSGEVRSLMVKMDTINGRGQLVRIGIPELQRLSGLYPREPDSRVQRETLELAEVIYHYVVASEEVRDIRGLGIYSGDIMKMAIVPVGRPGQLLTGGIQAHFDFIRKQLIDGIDHFYVVSTETNIKFAKMLVERACSELQFAKVFAEKHEGKFRGRPDTLFCSLIASFSG